MEHALAHVRGGNGPYFLEAQLVRWPGSHQIVHEFTTGETDVTAAWDDGKASNEHAEWQRTDPILRYAPHADRARHADARTTCCALDNAEARCRRAWRKRARQFA